VTTFPYNREACFALRSISPTGSLSKLFQPTFSSSAGWALSVSNTQWEKEEEPRDLITYRRVPFVKGFRGKVTVNLIRIGAGSFAAAPQTLEAVLGDVLSLGYHLEAQFTSGTWTRVNLTSIAYDKPEGKDIGIEYTLEFETQDLFTLPVAPDQAGM
jgi:hypothetical protein